MNIFAVAKNFHQKLKIAQQFFPTSEKLKGIIQKVLERLRSTGVSEIVDGIKDVNDVTILSPNMDETITLYIQFLSDPGKYEQLVNTYTGSNSERKLKAQLQNTLNDMFPANSFIISKIGFTT